MATVRDILPVTSTKVPAVIAVGLFGILTIALFRLQVVEYSRYHNLAENNYVVQASIKAPRGDIIDRNGFVIAGSRQSFSICAVPLPLLANEEEIRALGSILEMDEDFIRSRLKQTALSYRPTPIVRDADFVTLSLVEELYVNVPDVMVVSEPVRAYPRGLHFSHMIGHVGEVTDDEIAAGSPRYLPGDFIGKTGVEKQYEEYLRGVDGQRYVEFSPGQGTRPLEVTYLPADNPQPGMRLVLHADDGLQLLAHSLLKNRNGCIVALDVRTGGVLAMASGPTFDPNLFAAGISSADWSGILGTEGNPLINRVIQSRYPPGSVYKMVTAGAALERGLVSRGTRFKPCTGSYRFGNRDFACWKEQGHGSLDLLEAIEVSCDVYFYQMGERLGLDNLSASTNDWHLGQKTGIDLPGEIAGLVPDTEYYDRTLGKRKWTRGVMLNLSIGQGELLITPLDMLCFVSALANGGAYREPRCVRRAQSDGRDHGFETATSQLAMSRSTIMLLRESMLMVVEGTRGTGRAARQPGIKVAGKTGTAQNPHGDDHASFICFAPYDDPEIALFVLLENAGHGGAVAAPVAGEMLSYYFGEVVLGEQAATR